mgnify:FL=1
MMTTTSFEGQYYYWLLGFVYDDSCPPYDKLLEKLSKTEFVAIIERDDDRIKDGLRLRWQFADSMNYLRSLIDRYICGPCSVLEVMIALALRCEVDIMTNDTVGDRSGQWFWQMIASLGLGVMTDDAYDEEYCDNVLSIFLNRNYSEDGRGSLFTVEGTDKDMRLLPIWGQMNLFIQSIA